MRAFMAAEDLWPPAGRLLLAVSGGQDSTALLLALTRLAPRRHTQLVVAHFDHGLRGPEAAGRELAFVQGLCVEHGLPLVAGSANVRARAREDGMSLEEAARACRYQFLAGAAREQGCSHVATGHTATDQAETVLLHLLRGSGLRGLGGMAPRSAWPLPGNEDLMLVRPLLSLSREETLAYCRAYGVEPLADESNQSPVYLRNRVRQQVLPLLRELNPAVEHALARLARAARADDTFLDSLAANAVRATADGVALPRAELSTWPEGLRQRALQIALERLVGDRRDIGERHLRALQRLLQGGRSGDSLDLPRGVRALLTRDDLLLARGTAAHPRALPETAVCLPVPGEARFGHLVVAAGPSSLGGAEQSVEVDAAAAVGGLRVRRRRAGDRFQPLGMAQAKKLQDFFVDSHVPRIWRDAVPIFESERGIVWVGGCRIAEWARPRPGCPVLTLSYRSLDPAAAQPAS